MIRCPGCKEWLVMGVGFIPILGKNHPGITPFGYCLVPLRSATLLRETSVTLRLDKDLVDGLKKPMEVLT